MTQINDLKHQKQEKLRLSLRKERNKKTFLKKDNQAEKQKRKYSYYFQFTYSIQLSQIKAYLSQATNEIYQDYLINNLKQTSIQYIDQNDNCSSFLEELQMIDKVIITYRDFYDPIDKSVLQKYSSILKKLGIQSEIKENLSYLCPKKKIQNNIIRKMQKQRMVNQITVIILHFIDGKEEDQIFQWVLKEKIQKMDI
ncbi:unnamed protein product [Paramecium sonneborni]|uniref:Uncharacterized protein n=1 Tax=Paramecium sonneborni TaxID=65129 RepID=A0A8S1M1G0_9CILI|nr:unnamed protein product [Paramecium sonneborni]